ncbi:VQ motif-containing protein 25-like [Juglans microcarpa x Juglans regia]|uniref:VQ motif-containing protein 25-like n=1 Tax=Juglans microcarpa x Juglans regia TaxID=2249226 RepID=UPI001B7F4BF1|nr:VQ motif-containing protein 25-like [Juglans microcarpa x Juglans regia]
MEVITKNQSCKPCSTSTPDLAVHQDSKKISKPKPKIRIIHIFAPEIIKTDAANFRELVQRLTGKPSTEKGCNEKPRITGREKPRTATFDEPVAKKIELRPMIHGLESRERVKDEEGMWNGEKSGGFLGGFADLEGFIQELGEFPLLPLDANSHMHGFGEAQLA